MKKAETIKLQQNCSRMILFPPPKVPVVMVPSLSGRGDLGPLTLLQGALPPLATPPTVAPSATRTHPVVDRAHSCHQQTGMER